MRNFTSRNDQQSLYVLSANEKAYLILIMKKKT